MTTPPIHRSGRNREAWLSDAVELMRRRLFPEHGFSLPDEVRISVGFPHGKRGGRIGECWAPEASKDGVGEIFIHPILDDPIRVLDVIAHECVHVINHKVGQSGHGKVFSTIAKVIGLEGKMTATIAGERLTGILKEYSTVLGVFPHRALTPGVGVKRQGTRLLKGLCPGCGYVIRLTAKWSDLGLPTCICGEEFTLEE